MIAPGGLPVPPLPRELAAAPGQLLQLRLQLGLARVDLFGRLRSEVLRELVELLDLPLELLLELIARFERQAAGPWMALPGRICPGRRRAVGRAVVTGLGGMRPRRWRAVGRAAIVTNVGGIRPRRRRAVGRRVGASVTAMGEMKR